MYYTNRQLAERYVASFLPPRKMAETIDITLLSAADADLSLLVPNSPNQGRVYAREDLLVVWAAGERPFLSIYDHRRREGLVWLATAAAPAWELSRPACAILNAAAAAGPWTVCHGAAIGRGGRMLFLAGPGRAGKTTAAIACVHAGWDYAGDDYVLVNSRTGAVEPLYASARLRDDMKAVFPDMIAASRTAVSCDFGETKHELDVSRIMPGERLRGGRIVAALLPHRAGASDITFRPAGRGELFQALFAVTNQGAPGPLHQHAKKLAALTFCAPVFTVDTGSLPVAIPAAFEAFMARV